MAQNKSRRLQRPLLAAALCLATAGGSVHAEGDTSENVREFLSDPHRVGSLTGIILGGALTAHPAGAAAGSILGFFVGKQSMFKSPEKQRLLQAAEARPSFIPAGGGSETQTLALANSGPLAEEQAPEETITLAAVDQGAEETLAPVAVTEPAAELVTPIPEATVPTQIAAHCYGDSGASLDPRMQAMCYYFQAG